MNTFKSLRLFRQQLSQACVVCFGVLSLFFISACSKKALDLPEVSSSTISGTIAGYSSSSSLSMSQSMSASRSIAQSGDLHAMACASAVASLYKLDDNGNKIEPALGTANVGSDGSYSFNARTLGIKFHSSEPDQPLIVSISGCTSGVYMRPITGAKNQTVSMGSTAISYLLNTNNKDKIASALKSNIAAVGSLISSLESASSLNDAYTLLNSNASTTFTNVFGVAPTVLGNASPEIISSTLPSSASELVATHLVVNVSHISSSYNAVYSWKLDNTVIGTQADWQWTPGANTQGTHTLTLTIGEDDGAGNVDTSKPNKVLTQALTITNNVLPTAPSIAVTVPTITGTTPINTRSLTVAIDTGTSMANCASFSSLALTENDASTPAASAFTITCTQGTSQSLSYTLTSSGDGAKTLRLWAKDASGTISSTPTSTTVYLDTGTPTTAISTSLAAFTNTATQTFAFAASDNGGVIDHYECKIDAGSYAACSSPKSYSSLAEGDHTFYVRAYDTAGNVSNVDSKTWHIDLTAPTLSVSGSPNTITNQLTATFSFSASDTGGGTVASILCNLDSAGYAACASPYINVLTAGTHTLLIKATDTAGNVSSVQSFSWTIDTTAPTTTISSKPSSLTNSTSASFSFSATDSGGGSVASYECNLDSAGYSTCSSPKAYSSLAAGAHTVLIRALDTAGNIGTAASYTWTIDTTAPTVTISSSPSSLVNSTSASFSFSATDAGGGTVASYACKVDSGSYAACTSPANYSGLSAGAHTFYVTATDSVGNISSAATASWSIDTTAPTVTISSQPSALTNATSASFSFSATDSGGGTVASYACKIDSGSYAACTSPQAYSSLTQGSHTFYITATDSVGNVSAASTYSWTVDTTAPTVTISSQPNSLTNSTSASFSFSGTDTGGGTVASYECQIDAGGYSACTSPQAYSSLSSAAHTFNVRAIDTAGNTGSAVTGSWTVDTTTPLASISSGPNSITNSTSASFTFSANPPPSGSITGYECNLDSAGWVSCTTPASYSSLAAGAHTFSIRSIDNNSNRSSATSQSWTIDLTAPSVTISSSPSSVTASTSASFSFSATDSGGGSVASYACKIDSGSYATCSSPQSYSSLAAGAHTFYVTATDTAGNTSTAVTSAWTIDLTGPTTTISSNPSSITNSTSAAFNFAATDSGGSTVASYSCKLDSASFATCTSGVSYSSLTQGSHSFQVYSTDAVGNVGSTQTYSWTVDTTAPTVTISSSPSSPSNSTSASIAFSATDSGGGSVASYQCKIDAGSYSACTSPQAYSSLATGSHTVSVTATDTAGNTSTAATATWVVDTTAPTLTINSNPTSLNNATSASFTFSATDTNGVASYSCKIDSASYAGCSSPISYSSLTQGSHTFYVTATDNAGNTSSAQTYTWTTDLTAPSITLSSTPNAITNSSSASFSFSATDSGGGAVASYSCKVDSGSYASCTSPVSYSSLTAGSHTFSITSTDTAGNTSSATTYSWTIDQTAPTITISSTPSSPTNATTASFSFSATDSGGGAVASYSCKVDSGSYASCTSPVSYSSLAAGSHTFYITATDTAGNTSSATSVNWTVDLTAPTISITTPSSNGTVALTSGLATYTIAGSCSENGQTVTLAGSVSTTASCASGAWTTTVDLSALADGTLSVTATQSDVAGNSTTTSARTIIKDTVAPTITVTTPSAMQGNVSTGSVTWSLTEPNVAASTNFTVEIYNGTSWSSVGTKAATAGANSSTSYTLSNFAVPNVDVTTAKIRVTMADAAGNSTTSQSGTFTIDSTAPVLSSVIINDGATYAGTALVSVKVGVSDNVSTGSQISIRFASANASTGDCQSEYANNSWQTWTNSSTNLSFTITPTDGTKKICAWAKDAVGNISVISPSAGTSGVNYSSIQYSTGNPPAVVSFSVTKTSGGGYVATSGDALTIAWSASDVEGLDNNPVNISYTTDNSTWKDITTNLDISTASNRTWVGSLSNNPTTASGTITTFTAPSSAYFKLKIQVRDMAGNASSYVSSQAFNTGNWSVYAGTKDRGDGGTGRAASLTGAGFTNVFAINPTNGDIYASDNKKGVRKLDAKTGLVSTFISKGTVNLPADGALPANPTLPSDEYNNIMFDSKGRLYIGVVQSGSYAAAVIYQIDLANSWVRKYAGGGIGDDGGSAATSLQVVAGGYSFDEQDSLYVWTYCGGVVVNSTTYATVGKRIVKIVQNSDGTPGMTTRIIGDCTVANPTSGVSAYAQPATTFPYNGVDIVAWDNGNKIVVMPPSTHMRYKIINGVVYSTSLSAATSSIGVGAYNTSDGYLYRANGTAIEKVLINTSGANGDVVTTVFNYNSSTSGCSADGTTTSSYCGFIGTQIVFRSGVMYFADGVTANATSDFSIRYFDSNDTLRTVFGNPPFVGDGMNKNLARGSFAGIYYKKSTEPNLTAFPEGLYFMERAGLVLGHINPSSGVVTQLWGNQARLAWTPVTGTTISKNLTMGSAYAGGDGFPLAFDSSGLPWVRINSDIVSVDANKNVVRRTNQSASRYLQLAANNANPANYGAFPYVGLQNFTLKNTGLFVTPNYVYTTLDPIISIRYMDFTNSIMPIIIGGSYLASSNTAASADIATPGGVAAAPLYTQCRGLNSSCYLFYDSNTDRLYFSENTKLRYITTPSNTSTATLATLFTSDSTVYNFALNLDSSQLWYFKSNGGLYCYDISSGKSWCDNTTDHFAIRTSAGFTFSNGANQITFKDNQTMFLSTYNGEILQFNLPTTP